MSEHAALILTGLGTAALVLLGVAGLFLTALGGVRSELANVRVELMSILRDMGNKIDHHGERISSVEHHIKVRVANE